MIRCDRYEKCPLIYFWCSVLASSPQSCSRPMLEHQGFQQNGPVFCQREVQCGYVVRFKFTYTFFVTFGRHSCLNPLQVVAQSRAQLLEPRRAGGLASRNSEVLSLSPSLLLVLAARKCSRPQHVTLMLAFTSLHFHFRMMSPVVKRKRC